jgi:pyruvate formate lyase activating enzyme
VPNVEAIYEALKEMKLNNIHIEITNLVIPKMGDSLERIKQMATWIKNYLGADTPFHLLRFHPDYRMTTVPATPIKTLEDAWITAKEAGLHYTYLGNVSGHPAENTICPKCDEVVIKRQNFEITKWNLTADMKCPVCGQAIPIEGQFHSSNSAFPYGLF